MGWARVDPVEVGDIVPVVTARRRVDRVQPEAGHPEFVQVVDAVREPADLVAFVRVDDVVARLSARAQGF